MEEVKSTWVMKYSREMPTEFVSRLECELARYDPGADSTQVLSCAKETTQSRMRDLNKELRNEEFFFEVLCSVISDREHGRSDSERQPDVTAMYTKVNKHVNSKLPESPVQSDEAIDENMTHSNLLRLSRPASGDQIEGSYEEIEFRNNKQPATAVKKKQLRGSVKAKIQQFERSDSSSNEENTGTEGDYARLVIKPTVSTKPSPASKRRPRENEYEDIALPCFASNTKPEDPSDSKIKGEQFTQVAANTDTKSSRTVLKQDGYSSITDQTRKNKPVNIQQNKRQAPPVPIRRSRGTSSEHIDSVLKDTEALTLKYSEHGPQLASSAKQKPYPIEDVKTTDRPDTGGLHRQIENGDGDYCAIRSVNSDNNRHVTLVQVTSGSKIRQTSNKRAEEFADIKRSDRELSRSTENISKAGPENLTRNLSKSFDDLNQDGDYAELECSKFNPDSKEKSFKYKNVGSFSLVQGNDPEYQIIGKRHISLSSTSGSEEDLCSTVVVNMADLLSDMKGTTESTVSTSPKLKDRRKRVPDYEKWNFQTLLTQTGISVAENENLTDTGSEDDCPYDNIVDKQSDDSGMYEPTDTPDDKEKLYAQVYEPRQDTEKQGVVRTPDTSTTSTSTDGSRISTASCVTIDGDSVFLQRTDSVDGPPVILEDDDRSSIYDNDHQVDRGDLEDTLKDDACVRYRSSQLHMRHLVVKGILESEKSYLNVIEQLVKAKHYLQSVSMKPGSQSGGIALEDVTTIFYKMDEFYQIHKEFVDDLTGKVKNWSDDQRIAEAIKKLVVYFKAYEEYVNNYPIALETIKKYQRNEETRHLLEDNLESYKEEALKLEDVLLKPVQRIQTNHLVLHDLIKHTPEDHPDHRDLARALKLSEENLRMYNAHPGNLNCNKNLEARQLVKSGFLVEVSRDKKASRHLRYVFLFSDIIVCTKHKGSSKYKDVSFKYVWFLPLPELSMHVRGDQKYAPKESLHDLKNKIGNLKVELRAEMLKADSTKDKRAVRNIEKLKKKIMEQEATLVEALPRLPLYLEGESFRMHTFLFSTDYEREEWREALESQHIKCEGMPAAQLSNHDIDALIGGTKLHMHVNGICTAILKKDEEMLNGSLNVTIHKMQGLETQCEVYCCMEMDSYGHFFKKAQTRTSPYTTDASWNQDFELDLDGSQTLRILCYRKQPDHEDDVIIGKCALELSFSWLNSKFNEKTISMNDISITISIRHTPASKTLKRTQSKLRTGMFGVRIENATRRENKTVPSVVTMCVQEIENRGLDEVGIYRVSGVTSDVEHFKKLFDKNVIAAGVQADQADIHTITGVLKLYFRELPEPLFTDCHYQSFIQTIQLQNEETKEKCMLELLHCVPDANYYTIVFMIEHLVRVSRMSSDNKMSQSNLATIFGPTLMHPAMQETHADPMAQMVLAARDASVQSQVVYYFIKLAASGKNIRKSAGTESSNL